MSVPRSDPQHTIYLAATPEYGKATFLERMTREAERARAERARQLPAVPPGLRDELRRLAPLGRALFGVTSRNGQHRTPSLVPLSL